jgi:hypothetical protein
MGNERTKGPGIWIPESTDAAPSKGARNVLLVSIDTLRADHIGARAELYNAGTDSALETNLLDTTSSTGFELIDQFERMLAARRSESVTVEEQEFDSATLAQLHALG